MVLRNNTRDGSHLVARKMATGQSDTTRAHSIFKARSQSLIVKAKRAKKKKALVGTTGLSSSFTKRACQSCSVDRITSLQLAVFANSSFMVKILQSRRGGGGNQSTEEESYDWQGQQSVSQAAGSYEPRPTSPRVTILR